MKDLKVIKEEMMRGFGKDERSGEWGYNYFMVNYYKGREMRRCNNILILILLII